MSGEKMQRPRRYLRSKRAEADVTSEEPHPFHLACRVRIRIGASPGRADEIALMLARNPPLPDVQLHPHCGWRPELFDVLGLTPRVLYPPSSVDKK